MREHLYSMNVVIVTINGEMDDTHYAIMNHKGAHFISITSDILGYNE